MGFFENEKKSGTSFLRVSVVNLLVKKGKREIKFYLRAFLSMEIDRRYFFCYN
jgi:hypothetical protein